MTSCKDPTYLEPKVSSEIAGFNGEPTDMNVICITNFGYRTEILRPTPEEVKNCNRNKETADIVSMTSDRLRERGRDKEHGGTTNPCDR